MQLLLLTIILISLIKLTTESIVIHVSLDGKDVQHCGSIIHPCYSLQGALDVTTDNNTIIVLDGGNTTSSYVYEQKHTIELKFSINITIKGDFHHPPTILGRYPLTDHLFLFRAPSTLIIDSVVISDLLLVAFDFLGLSTDAVSAVRVSNSEYKTETEMLANSGFFSCLLYSPLQIYLDHFRMNDHSEVGLIFLLEVINNPLEIYIINSTVGNDDMYIDIYIATTHSVFKLINSTLLGGGISLANFSSVDISQLTIKSSSDIFYLQFYSSGNITIEDTNFPHVYNLEFVGINYIRINNCLFGGVQDLEPYQGIAIAFENSDRVEITASQFLGGITSVKFESVAAAAIVESYFSKIQFQNTEFHFIPHYDCLSILTISRTHMQINSSGFTENRSKKGGAIYTKANSTLKIFSSVFNKNYAESAGTFYFDNTTVEIHNTTIKSCKNDLPFFVTLIEDNGGPITMKDVDIEILYINSSSIDIFSFTIANIIPNFTYSCPPNANIKLYDNKLWSCEPCTKGSYSLQQGHLKINQHENVTRKAHCHICPFGGLCENGIVSRPNFWGFVEKRNVIFYHCPEGYCCNGKDILCNAISTCNKYRHGAICGRCTDGYQIDYFNTDCIPTSNCFNVTVFWAGYIFSAVIVFLVLAYLKEITRLFKKLARLNSKTKPIHKRTSCLESLPTASGSAVLDSQCLQNETQSISEDAQSSHNISTPIQCSNNVSNSNNTVTNDVDDENDGLAFSVIKILVNFYQLNMLIKVESPNVNQTLNIFRDLAETVFTLKLELKNVSANLCPMKKLDAITKLFIRDVFFIITIILVIIITNLMLKIYHTIKRILVKRQRGNLVSAEIIQVYDSFRLRSKICLLQVILIGYTNISTFTLQMLNCVKVNDDYVLQVDGTVSCFTSLQYGMIALLLVWVIPFCVVIVTSTTLLQDQLVTVTEFLLSLIFPPLSLFYYVTRKRCESYEQIIDSADKIKQVLLVVKGAYKETKDNRIVVWDGVILIRRLLIASLVTFITNPIVRLSVVCLTMLIYLLHNFYAMPYRIQSLNSLELLCMLCLCFLASVNLFWAFIYVYSLPYIDSIRDVGQVFNIFETALVVAPLILLLLYLVFTSLKRIYLVLIKKCSGKYA